MEQRPSWEVNWSSATQGISRILWKLKVHYRVHNSPKPVPVLSQIDLVLSLHPTSRRFILTLSFHLRLGFPSGLLSSRIPSKTLYSPLLAPIRATCPAHLSLFYLITRMIFGEEYRVWSSLLCSFLHSPVTSSILGPNILLSTLFSRTLRLHSSLSVSGQVFSVLILGSCVRFLTWLTSGGPPLVGCPRLLTYCIRSYPPYLEAVTPTTTGGRAMPLWQRLLLSLNLYDNRTKCRLRCTLLAERMVCMCVQKTVAQREFQLS
jgi:hypothetical protein